MWVFRGLGGRRGAGGSDGLTFEFVLAWPTNPTFSLLSGSKHYGCVQACENMLAPSNPIKTVPIAHASDFDLNGIKHAVLQGELGLKEGGVPIGAALVRSDGTVVGVGRNRRVQQNSATRHGETDCLENIGVSSRVPFWHVISELTFSCTASTRFCLRRLHVSGASACFRPGSSAQLIRTARMFTTLSPCTMCTGAMILYGIKRCVMGENNTFVGGESILKDHGVEVVNLNLDSCKALMAQFIKQSPEIWNEVRLLLCTD